MFLKFKDRKIDLAFCRARLAMSKPHRRHIPVHGRRQHQIGHSQVPEFLAVTLRGPVSKGTQVECPPNGEWLAIRFGFGNVLPRTATDALTDHQDMQLPVLNKRPFLVLQLDLEDPDYENAEALVHRWARAGVIARSHATDAAVEGDVDWMSRRSVQRHFRRVTGMTFSTYQQIQRARHAASLLMSGSSILDVTFAVGYFDQAHLTRSVKHLIGMTPARRDASAHNCRFHTKLRWAGQLFVARSLSL